MLLRNLWLLGIASCTQAAPQDTGPAPLVDMASWQLLDDSRDPIGPAPSACDPLGVGVETDILEIDTEACPWVTLGQRSLVDLQPGDTLSLLAWHSALSAPEPAVGLMGLWIGDQELWRTEPAIPGDATIYELELPIDSSFPLDTQVRLHVHNHGANAWRLGRLERR